MIALLGALACVLANAFFVAAEFALVKARPSALEAMSEGGDARATRALAATRKLDAFLGATQLGITLASLGLGWLGEPALAHLVEPALLWLGLPVELLHPVSLGMSFTVITLLHVVVGELAPKSLAIQRPQSVAKLSAGPMFVFYWLVRPLLYVLNGAANRSLQIAGIKPLEPGAHAPSAEEIRIIVDSSARQGALDSEQRDMLESVLQRTSHGVKAIMVPRVDMTVVCDTDPLEACKLVFRRSGHSRLPVCENGDPDRAVGYLYAKDIWFVGKDMSAPASSMKRALAVFEEKRSVVDALNEFRTSATHMAIVKDRHGGTSGMLTLEDCLEEIVGEIRDETDRPTATTEHRPDGTIVVDGTTSIADLERDGVEELDAPPSAILGAFIVESLRRLARKGDRLHLGAWEARVLAASRKRIHRVALRRLSPEELEQQKRVSSRPGSQPARQP